jgi:hypothetical protein
MQVTLPIGTEIRFRISTWSKFITMISVKPSIYDINEAKGLCGVPSTNKDRSDDFTHRQYGPVNDYKTFADSWRYYNCFSLIPNIDCQHAVIGKFM